MNEDTILSVRKWLTEGVDVTEFFFTRFKGDFRGKLFEFEWLPSAVVPYSVYVKSIIILFVIFV